jgi:sec-independent protein translocase protein TatA
MGFLREPSHLILIGIIAVVLFGGRKLPEAARGMGQAMRIFKAEVKGMKEDDAPVVRRTTTTTTEPVEPLEGHVVRPVVTTVDEPVRETPRNV